MLFFRRNIGWAIMVILAAIPVVRWAMLSPLSSHFASFSTSMTSFGQLSALIGATLFSVNLILASRFKFLDELFYGLNRVYIRHHLFGAFAFTLLLAHPIFLSASFFQSSVRAAIFFLLPSGNWAVNFGQFALILITILLILTFFVKLPYHIWKFTHQFLALAFVFIILHVFLIQSDISADLFLRVFILGLICLAGLCELIMIFKRIFKIGYTEYIVQKVHVASEKITEIELKPIQQKITFRPGQFAFLKIKSAQISQEKHPFSITASESSPNLSFGIKALGDYTGKIRSLQPNDLVLIEGPFGKFSYRNGINKEQIWIAGGIGITPFLSMARSLKPSEGYKINLYYSFRGEKEGVFAKELATLGSEKNNLQAIIWNSETQGALDTKAMAEKNHTLKNKSIFICGPIAMMKSVKKKLIQLGATDNNIHTEEFSLYNF